ncbi:MAG: hypothetical protein ACFCVD_20940 [Nodosilinea sp.]
MSERSVRNRAEWVSLGISLTLLTGVVATVISLWLNPSLNPARFTLDPGPVRHEADQYYLPVTITNEGDATGSQVTVEGILNVDNNPEVSNTTVDFIPARSAVEVVLIFSHEPAAATLRVASYQEP